MNQAPSNLRLEATTKLDLFGETLTLTPTKETATDWAQRFITELSKDVALGSRLTSAAAGLASGAGENRTRRETVDRLAQLLLSATSTELSRSEASTLLGDAPACPRTAVTV